MNNLFSYYAIFIFLLINLCCTTYTEKTYWPNNNLKTKIVLDKKSNLFAGKYAEYYITGYPKEVRFYKNDVPVKSMKQWYEDGSIKLIRIINETQVDTVQDTIDGMVVYNRIFLSNYSEIKYFPNGKEEYSGKYQENKKTGWWVYYDSTGKEVKTVRYLNDSVFFEDFKK